MHMKSWRLKALLFILTPRHSKRCRYKSCWIGLVRKHATRCNANAACNKCHTLYITFYRRTIIISVTISITAITIVFSASWYLQGLTTEQENNYMTTIRNRLKSSSQACASLGFIENRAKTCVRSVATF